MVIGGDSRPRGRGFKSRYRILDGHFFTFLVAKIVCLKRPKIRGPFSKKDCRCLDFYSGTLVSQSNALPTVPPQPVTVSSILSM